MIRRSGAAALMGLALTGCGASLGQATPGAPALAAYFDCVRETGIAISAHRSISSADHPENSIAAIRDTARAIPGAIVEVDVARTRDGALILMHDQTLQRTTDGEGRVGELTLAQIRAVRLKTAAGVVTQEQPPTLEEALAAAGRAGAIISLDLKRSDAVTTGVLMGEIIDQVRRSRAQDRTILITSSAGGARMVSAMAPEMMISASIDDVSDLAGLNTAQVLAWTGTTEPRPGLWRALKERGVEPQFGTLGRPGTRLDDIYAADGDVSEYRDLFEQGVRVIATDTPLAVLGVLRPEVEAAARCRR
jgi:glycerophosphoryl diester phosphodiesterase